MIFREAQAVTITPLNAREGIVITGQRTAKTGDRAYIVRYVVGNPSSSNNYTTTSVFFGSELVAI